MGSTALLGFAGALPDSGILRGTRPRALLVRNGVDPAVTVALPEEGLRVGRATYCDLRIGVAGDGTSRQHAKLYWRRWRLYLRDLQSKNGLTVNGDRFLEGQLWEGDEIVIGRTRLIVLADEEDKAQYRSRIRARKKNLPSVRPRPVICWESGRLFPDQP